MRKVGMLICRLQPRHIGHNAIIQQAAEQCDHLMVLIGSANRPRSIRNPWTYEERMTDLVSALPKLVPNGFSVYPLNDYRYANAQWTSDVEASIVHLMASNPPYFSGYSMEPILFGHDKPGNDYLKDFRHWKFINLDSPYPGCSTDIREHMFSILAKPDVDPVRHLDSHCELSGTDATFSSIHQHLVDDWRWLDAEQKTFADYKFKETLQFNCSDAVVECDGHILLIKRGNSPGKGCWALPGGFKENNETFADCAFRELTEETNLRVPEKKLRGSVQKVELFDDPHRGHGIPRNTVAYYIKIEADPNGEKPRVTPKSDAVEAKWWPFYDVLNKLHMHDDHQDIIYKMTGSVPMPAHLSDFYTKYSRTL